MLSGTGGGHRHTEYVLTSKGRTLWPVVRSLLAWGDEHYSESGPRRVFQHAADGGPVGRDGTCSTCGQDVPVQDLLVVPGPGLATRPARTDPASAALAAPHRLLEPGAGLIARPSRRRGHSPAMASAGDPLAVMRAPGASGLTIRMLPRACRHSSWLALASISAASPPWVGAPSTMVVAPMLAAYPARSRPAPP